jgi:cyclic pyranopterin phosphate synthase
MDEGLTDQLGRRLEYLRLSVTDRCDFRCAYCLPDGCARGGEAPLSVAEVQRLVRAFAALGVWKVRLTGGEPTLRPDLPELVAAVARTPGVRAVGITTNGYRLAALAPALLAQGATAVNVSVDSLDPVRFAGITGRPALDRVLGGVEAALDAGVPAVKVNVVMLRGLDGAELDRFLEWTRGLRIAVRFIELMRTGDNADFFRRFHLGASVVRAHLEARGWAPLPRDPADGPAESWRHPGHLGKAGLIAAYAHPFCET